MNKRRYKETMTIGIILLFLGAGSISSISVEGHHKTEQRGTIIVPDDYPTIQAAIDAASNGDTVLVCNGTYTGEGNRDIDMGEKKLVLRSKNGPQSTIIDCEGSEIDPHRGFYIWSANSSDSVIEGFTITNGWAEIGGGIFIDNYYHRNNPTITNCIFYNNTATNGGGVYCITGDSPFQNCIFANNRATDSGGGMVIILNQVSTFWNCTFVNNSAGNDGGGIDIISCDIKFLNCKFINNSAGHNGGGVFCNLQYPVFINMVFYGNSAGNFGGGFYSIGAYQHFTDFSMKNALFTKNQAQEGGGLYADDWTSATITDCDFIENSAANIGGLYESSNGALTVYHNNFMNNTGGHAYGYSITPWDSSFPCGDGYPTGGNYWDDYNGTDLYHGPDQDIPGSDGIGDTSYDIPGGVQDRYPFMQPNGWLLASPLYSFLTLSPGGLTTCPSGDGPAFQYALVTVQNYYKEPLASIPAGQIIWTVQPYPGFPGPEWFDDLQLSCIPIDAETDEVGEIRFEIIGNTSIIGDIILKVAVNGIELNDIDRISCISFDHNVNGSIDLPDLAFFSTEGWTNQNLECDYNWDGSVDLVDFAMFAEHWGHSH